MAIISFWSGENKESGVTKNARKRVAESTSPT